jgi:hypothetical protein
MVVVAAIEALCNAHAGTMAKKKRNVSLDTFAKS